MTVMLSPAPYLHFHDNDGRPLSGGFLYTYIAGTTTPLSTYKDATGSIPNTNPIVLDFRGEASVWLDITRSYKFVLRDRTGALIWTQDNVFGGAAQSMIQEAIKTADDTITGSDALRADPELLLTLPVIGQYDIEIFLIFDAGGATADASGFKCIFPQGFSDTRGTIPVLLQGSVNGLLIGNVTQLENTFSFLPISGPANSNIVLIKGSILAQSVGNLGLQFAQETVGQGSTVLRAGSYLKATLARANVAGAGSLQRIYGQATSLGVEQIPQNFNTVTVEVWGAGGGGGGALVSAAGSAIAGGGGGSGQYARAVFQVTAIGGTTLQFSVGGGGAGGSNASSAGGTATPGIMGGASTVTGGTAPISVPNLNCAGGLGGSPAVGSTPGAGGAGGQSGSSVGVTTTPGNDGTGILGGIAVPGINAGGTAGGNGGGIVNGALSIPQTGQDGRVVFTYTV